MAMNASVFCLDVSGRHEGRSGSSTGSEQRSEWTSQLLYFNISLIYVTWIYIGML